ncbi:MAG: N-acetyltransferase [Candidatus Omnitrophica bacterium]|nr:N-acetyltransferase [Candidatus Omnitrophota bacterium]
MIRKAKITDVKEMQKLINLYASRDMMLARTLVELYENLRDYFVCEEGGKIVGTCALHISWEDLAEIKSLAVEEVKQNKGVGSSLVKEALREAKEINIKRVFVLTYKPDFFKKMDFQEIDKANLPQKIWGECVNCAKFPGCQETALILSL